MNDVFLKILNMSITASWLIIAVLLLRLVLRKSPKWINCLLWAIVALRLIMPFSIESIFSLVPSTETIETSVSKDTPIVIHSGIPSIDNNVHAYLKGNYNEPVNASTKQPIDVIEVISIIWLIGIPIMVLYGLISYIRVYKQVRISLLHEGNVYYCDSINSPFILGIIRPKIYIPSGISGEHVENIIKHEKAHLNRKDHWWKPLGFLLLTIYWFNPFIWVAYILLCRDIEAACDEKVIKAMDDIAKKDYSETLLSCSLQRRIILACPLAFGELGVKDRIKAVLNYKKPAFWVIAVAVIASIVVAVCFLTNPKEDKEVKIVQENNEKLDINPATSEPNNINVDENTSETSNSKLYEELVGRFRVNEAMPEYVISAYFTNAGCSELEQIVILDSTTRSEIQTIDVPYNENFTDKAVYTLDINFDGNLDLVIPKERPASAVYFIAYVYDTENNEFVYAPSFESLPNFIIDNENERILAKRTSSQITSYSMSNYDDELNDFVVTNSLYWEPDENNTHLVEERLNADNELEIVQDLLIEGMDALTYDKTKASFSDYWVTDSFWDLDDDIWHNNFFLEADTNTTTESLGSPYLKYVDWEELNSRLIDEERQILSQYMSVLKDEEKFYYNGTQVNISEFTRQLNPADTRSPNISDIMFADVFQSGSKDLIIHHTHAGWGYLILHYENDILYGINMYERHFQDLQENGIYHGSGGASTGDYHRMTFNNGDYTEIDIAQYERDPVHEYYYLYGEVTTAEEFELWEQNNTNDDVFRYYVEAVEYAVLPLFNSFLNGSIDAIDKSGNTIKISEMDSESYRKYTEYDMNGDNIPELCIKTSRTLSIFEIKDGNIVLWREDSPYCTILNNSAILYKRHGGAPEHKTYIYYETDSDGNTVYEITFTKYESTYIDGIYHPELYIINNREVDETEYINKTEAILNIRYNLINWHDF